MISTLSKSLWLSQHLAHNRFRAIGGSGRVARKDAIMHTCACTKDGIFRPSVFYGFLTKKHKLTNSIFRIKTSPTASGFLFSESSIGLTYILTRPSSYNGLHSKKGILVLWNAWVTNCMANRLLVLGNMITWRHCYAAIAERIEYKLCTLVYRCLRGKLMHHGTLLITWHWRPPSVEGAACDLQTLSLWKCRELGDRVFSVAGPRAWNSLPIV